MVCFSPEWFGVELTFPALALRQSRRKNIYPVEKVVIWKVVETLKEVFDVSVYS